MAYDERILVVDDDPGILETLQECLRDEGYRVETALSVGEALPLLGDERFSLVLTDALVRLRGDRPDYWDAVEQIRVAAGASPVAILSAHSAERFAGLEARGFAALIRKPFEIDDFCTTVRQIIDRSGDGSCSN
jgi:DNA-binding response OmpR family regulator